VKRLLDTLRNPWARGLIVLALLCSTIAAVWWRGPEWEDVYHAFDFVSWRWIVAGVALNLLSVLARAVSWHLTIGQALPDPQPAFRHVFSAFGVGLLGNAVLPARAGELARVAVLRRHLPHGPGTSATLLGTVFAHRLFDLFPVSLLVLYVLLTARIPHWAVTSLIILGLVSIALLAVAMLTARRHGSHFHHDGNRTARRLLAMARQGLAVMRAPVTAAAAVLCQTVGWVLQLLAVWAVTEAFDMNVPLPAAALVLLLMNVATIFPLWPGNIGLLQAAVALPLRRYGVPYGTGFAFGIVLQALEMSVGVGVGLVMLAREGLSFASLRKMEDDEEASAENEIDAASGLDDENDRDAARESARVGSG
jgi:glycosyltransferase 2 family protein